LAKNDAKRKLGKAPYARRSEANPKRCFKEEWLTVWLVEAMDKQSKRGPVGEYKYGD
jgi:hypothetical protein